MDNSQKDESESVAEHVYGMHVLAEYFLPLYTELDAKKVHQLITWHDMAEAVVDDMTTRTKTDAHRQAEAEAERQITEDAAPHITNQLKDVFREYEEQESAEAKFTKAIDKVEPLFHMYFLTKQSDIRRELFKTKDSGWHMEEYQNHRRPYIESFDLIWRFDNIITPELLQAGFYKDSA